MSLLQQYISRTDILGCGGKLGWPKLDDDKLRECERDGNFRFIYRAGRTFKHTVQESLETCGTFLAVVMVLVVSLYLILGLAAFFRRVVFSRFFFVSCCIVA